ncbi:hypothetical protein [Aurantivibrio infirmus]
MKFTQILSTLLLIIFFSSTLHANDDISLDGFIAKFKSAVESNDLESILNMNNWSGLADEQRKGIEGSFGDIVQKGVKNIEMEIINDGEKIEFKKGVVIFSPNLPPVAKILVEVNTEQEFLGGYSYYIGSQHGSLKFCHVVPN